MVLLYVKCCALVHDYHISKTQVELPTFLFSGKYRSPRFASQNQHLSSFSAVPTATVKFYKTFFRFILFNLLIDHLYESISPFSIEFIKYIGYSMCLESCIVNYHLLEPGSH